jgi:hypothetical protein
MFGVRPVIRPVVASSQGRSAASEASKQRRDRPRAESARAEAAARADRPGPEDRPAAGRARPASTSAEDAGREDPRLLTDPDQPGQNDDPSGTDLVLRELGGTVIEETGDD